MNENVKSGDVIVLTEDITSLYERVEIGTLAVVISKATTDYGTVFAQTSDNFPYSNFDVCLFSREYEIIGEL